MNELKFVLETIRYSIRFDFDATRFFGYLGQRATHVIHNRR